MLALSSFLCFSNSKQRAKIGEWFLLSEVGDEERKFERNKREQIFCVKLARINYEFTRMIPLASRHRSICFDRMALSGPMHGWCLTGMARHREKDKRVRIETVYTWTGLLHSPLLLVLEMVMTRSQCKN